MIYKHIHILLFSLVICALSVTVGAESSPVGCEYYNSTVIKAWNNGSIEPVSYFHVDGVQMANALDRFDWATYDLGFMYNMNFFSMYDLDYDFLGCTSDNTTYYLLRWTSYFQQGNKRAWINLSIGQLLEDDYVNLTITFEPTGNGWNSLHQPVPIYRGLDNINIDLDEDTDVISYYNASGFQGQDLNITSDQFVEEILGEGLIVGDIDTSSAIRWKWTGDRAQGLLKENHPDNAGVVWWRDFLDDVESGETYTITEWWIDDTPCVISCPPGVVFGNYRIFCNNTGVWQEGTCPVWPDSLNFQLINRILHATFFLPGTCSYGPGCLLNSTSNSTGMTPPEEILYKTSQTEDKLVCDSYNAATCEQDEISSVGGTSYSLSRHYNLTCRKAEEVSTHSYFEFLHNWAVASMTLQCPPDPYPPGVDLQTPTDKASLPAGNIDFECNSTDFYPLVNGSLWGDWSGIWEENETTTILFTNYEYDTDYTINLPPGSYNWNCQFCDNNDQCNMSTANHTLTITEAEAPSQFIKASSEIKKNILLLLMFLIIYGGIIIGLYKILHLEKKWE